MINSNTTRSSIPQGENVSVIQGHNKGYDFGAYKQSIDSVDKSKFDFFIFMNDTCRGPFIPDYIPSNTDWVNLFVKDIDETIKLVGPTWVNTNDFPWVRNKLKLPIGKHSHIQSYCFGTDRTGVEILYRNKKFDTIRKDKWEIIRDHEIGCSQLLLSKGYKIKPFQLSQYNNKEHIDITKPGHYFNTTLNPLEVMFIKTNRIDNQIISNYTSWLTNKYKKT